MQKTLDRYFPYLLLFGCLLNATGLTNDILDPDGTLYATIAKHMANTNDFVNLFGDNHDWLDKPHLPFWITAVSFKIFGLTPFAYKFPGFLFWLGGLCFTYLIAKELYGKYTAQVTALVYLIALHSVIANFDVRAEPYLTTLTIGSIWFWLKDWKERKWYYLVLAALFAAGAVMTKGIFALLTIAGGFVLYWIITAQWKEFVRPRWWILAVLIFIFITPELYCLYVQFDLHPEKVVFGKTGVSGLRFFFWDSQFGRFFNTGPIKGSGDVNFFLHTTLWAFLPWSVYLVMAIYDAFRNKGVSKNVEAWLVHGGALLTFVLFSLSKFQLPHYIIILFPQFSIITGKYLVRMFDGMHAKTSRFIFGLQIFLVLLVSVFIITITFFAGIQKPFLISAVVTTVAIAALFFFRQANLLNTFAKAFAFSFLLYPFLNFVFYPYIMQYQAGMQAANWANTHKPGSKLFIYKEFSHAFEFYALGEPAWVYDMHGMDSTVSKEGTITVYARSADLDTLRIQSFEVHTLQHFSYFRISMLTLTFLNPATRPQAVIPVELATVGRKDIAAVAAPH